MKLVDYFYEKFSVFSENLTFEQIVDSCRDDTGYISHEIDLLLDLISPLFPDVYSAVFGLSEVLDGNVLMAGNTPKQRLFEMLRMVEDLEIDKAA